MGDHAVAIGWSVALMLPACASTTFLPTDAPGEEKKGAGWAPGDDVPGWEDRECEIPAGSDGYVFEPPDTFHVGLILWGTDHDEHSWHINYSARMTDCRLPGACEGEDPTDWGWLVDVFADDFYVSQHSRGQESYYSRQGWGGDEPTVAVSDGWLPWAGSYWESGGGYAIVPNRSVLCLSRVRPDQIEGVWTGWLRYAKDGFPDSEVWVSVKFGSRYEERSAYSTVCDPEGENVRPRTYVYEDYLTYAELSYEDFWPWDEITDPAVRDELYTRFRPYDCP